MSLKRCLQVCGCLLLYLMPAFASSTLVLDNTASVVNPTQALSYFADDSNRLTLEGVQQLPASAFSQTDHLSGSALNFGFSHDPYWIKLTLSRSATAPSEWVIEIPYLGLDQIDFYAPGVLPVMTGASRDIKSRALFHRFFVFPVTVETTPQDYYFRVKSDYAVTVPIEIYERQAFVESTQKGLIIQFLYFGGLLALIVYNFQLFLALRDKTYLLYALFGLFMGLGIFSGNGFGRILFWPNLPAWDQISQSVLLSFGACFSILFARSFLKSARLTPQLDFSLQALTVAYLIVGISLITTLWGVGSTSFWFHALMFLTGPYFILVSASAIRVLALGHESAKFYLVAWGFFCLGTILATLRIFNWVPTNVLTTYAIQIGLGFEMLFLSYALAYRIRIERAKREQAQSEALSSHQLMVDTLTKSEESLEHLVEKRTTQLKESLVSEKKLHEQYVRFGAMISHEFRNPLNNIQSQADLLLRERRMGIDQFDKRIGVISAATRQLALLFDRWMQSDRLNNALALRNVHPINLNLWLEDLLERYQPSTLDHHLAFENCSNEPMILVDDALIQIAVINLLDNACKYSTSGSMINVSVICQDDRVGIVVSDQGEGIDPSAHEAIFQEYFRVNPHHAKRGAGLGLAFVKRIAELHQGTIEVVSSLGSGTTFTLWLPTNSGANQQL